MFIIFYFLKNFLDFRIKKIVVKSHTYYTMSFILHGKDNLKRTSLESKWETQEKYLLVFRRNSRKNDMPLSLEDILDWRLALAWETQMGRDGSSGIRLVTWRSACISKVYQDKICINISHGAHVAM